MNKLSNEQKHEQCLKEVKGTLAVTALCALWHVATAFLLNGTGLRFLGMPAWFSVSVLGTIIIAVAGVVYLTRKVFRDFDYDDETEEGGSI